jgi:hypothetical protein
VFPAIVQDSDCSGGGGLVYAEWADRRWKKIRQRIRRMKAENAMWGAPRIHGELLQLGFEISEPPFPVIFDVSSVFLMRKERSGG